MRILCIVGIWNFRRLYNKIWRNLETAFKEKFPDASFEVEHLWYSPWEWQKMRDFANRLVEEYDTGEELLIVGYSLGGVIATAMAPRFKRSKVRCVVSIFAPHRYLFGLFSRMLDSQPSKIAAAPVISFGARLDVMVPWGSRYSETAPHVWIWSNHLLRLLFSKKPATQIAEETAALLATT